MKYIIDKNSFNDDEIEEIRKSKLDYYIQENRQPIAINFSVTKIIYVTRCNQAVRIKKDDDYFIPVIVKITNENIWTESDEIVDAKCKSITDLIKSKFITLIGEKQAYNNSVDVLQNTTYYNYSYPLIFTNVKDDFFQWTSKNVTIYACGRYFPKSRGKDNINVYSSKILAAKYANMVSKKFYEDLFVNFCTITKIKFDYCWYVPCKKGQNNRFENITDNNGIILTQNYQSMRNFGYNERYNNMKDKYCLNDHFDIKDKTIIVVDDIITTSATLETISRLLYDNGAKEVIWFVYAKTISNDFGQYKIKCKKCQKEYEIRFDNIGNPIIKCGGCKEVYKYKIENLNTIYK